MIKVKMGEIAGSQGAAAVKNQKIKEHGTLNEKGITELSSDHENYPLFLEELTEAAHGDVSLNLD